MVTVSRLAGDATVYLGGSLLVGLAGVLLLPLYTRHLPPAAFGVYGLVEAVIQVAVALLSLGFGVSYLKWFAELPEPRRRRVLGGVLVVAGGASVAGGLALGVMAGVGFGLPAATLPRLPVPWTIAPLVVCGVVTNVALTELRCQRRTLVFSLSSGIRLLCTVGASLYTVIVQPGGVAGVLYGRLVGEVVGVGFLLAATRPSLGPPGEWRELARMVAYGLPVALASLVIALLGVSGRYLLTWFGSLSDVGVFTAATKVAGVMSVVLVQPFGVAWGGLMFQIAKEVNARVVYAQIVRATWLGGWAAVVAVGFVTPELFALLTSTEYGPGERVFPWLLVNQLLILMQYPTGIGLYLMNRTGLLLWLYIAGLVVTALSGVVLVPSAGTAGAATAWLAGNVVITAATWAVGQRLYRLQSWPWESVTVAALGTVLLIAGTMARHPVWGRGLAVRGILGLVVVAAAVCLVVRRVSQLRGPGSLISLDPSEVRRVQQRLE